MTVKVERKPDGSKEIEFGVNLSISLKWFWAVVCPFIGFGILRLLTLYEVFQGIIHSNYIDYFNAFIAIAFVFIFMFGYSKLMDYIERRYSNNEPISNEVGE